MYRPFSLLDATRGIFVALSVKVTVAAAIAAPEGSVTVPATVPVEALCERRAEGSKAQIQRERAIAKRRLVDIQNPPIECMKSEKNRPVDPN